MQIAVTRLASKKGNDAEEAAKFGHTVNIVSPLAAEISEKNVEAFLSAANKGVFDAIFFTSAYPAEIVAPRMKPEAFASCRIIAIGPKTSEVLERYGLKTEILPQYYSRAFVPYLGEWIAGKKIGIPRAAVPNTKLMDGIRAAGGEVFEFGCYSLEPTGDLLDVAGSDAILFTSAMSFQKAVLPDVSGMLLMAVGDVTAEAMRAGGVEADVVGDGTLKGTFLALDEYLKRV